MLSASMNYWDPLIQLVSHCNREASLLSPILAWALEPSLLSPILTWALEPASNIFLSETFDPPPDDKLSLIIILASDNEWSLS